MPLPVLLQKIYLKPIERNTPAPDRTLFIRVMSHAEGATLNFQISQKKMALKAIFFHPDFLVFSANSIKKELIYRIINGCCITENVSYYTTGDKNTDVVEMDETTDKGNAKE